MWFIRSSSEVKVFSHNFLAFKTHGISSEGCSDGRGEEEAIEVGSLAEPTEVEAEDVSAGASEAEGERGPKLSFLFRNASLLLAFLLWVEGLDLFFTRLEFPLIFLVSREKQKLELMVREKWKSMPWLASV